MAEPVTILGAGLAGCEAAWQLANRGIPVTLWEMKPDKMTPAHHSPLLGELVCSNSLRSDQLENAVGLLKEELRRLNSLILRCADTHRVAAGGALAVDRMAFSQAITEAIQGHPNITLQSGEVKALPEEGQVIVATGPLTADDLAQDIARRFPAGGYLHFYDAAAPLVTFESIDMDSAWFASRYDKGTADYINCPLTQEEYLAFWRELCAAKEAPVHGFEDKNVFEGCMPVEVMARRGEQTLCYGPLKPRGLRDPKTGQEPFAVVQLRRDNAVGTIYNLVYTTNGIIGTPIQVCSTYIFLFVLFGSFLEATGIAAFFIDCANSIAGAATGGPAKVAVISSALCGMVSGSSVGNTVTTGAVTIPLMKRTGYPPEFAGAVEAAASTGGQIMPPIMGAAAFLMAEMTDTEYADILVRAILPAALYFTGIFLMVHFKAKSIGLKGLDKDSLPKGKDIFPKLYLLLPLIVLVFMVIQSGTFTMAYSAVVACLVAIVAGMADRETGSKKFVMMVPAIPLLVYALGKVYLPDVIPAFADSLEMQETFTLVCFGIFFVLVVACHLISKPNMQNVGTYINALESGTKSTLSVGVACGMAGIIAGVVTYTGLGQILINAIVGIAGGHLIIALVLTMVCCVILGMGVPTTANYIIMATTCAPILIQMGLPVLAAHFFVFYFGIVADITPPVALAAYAGSAIAKAPPMKTALNATRLAIAAFIIPYIFAYSPIMLFIGDDVNAINVIRVVITSFGGMFLIAAGLIGFMLQKLNIVLRLVSVAAGLMMIHPGAVTDLIGIAILIAILAYQVISEKRHAATA